MPKNIGYAKAYNYALKEIHSDVYCLVNNDVMVTKNWTLPIMSYFEKRKVDIAQPLILVLTTKRGLNMPELEEVILINLDILFAGEEFLAI